MASVQTVTVDQLHPKVTLYSGSCLDALPMMEADSIDACVCDPPYHLTTGKKGGTGPASLNENSPAGRARISTGFMGKAWDGGDVAFQVETWRQVFRVLKPGAHLIAFSGTRTYHRMACAIEDAGFEIRDQIGWLYGSGFPKSHDVSKGIDRAAGAERAIVGTARGKGGENLNRLSRIDGDDSEDAKGCGAFGAGAKQSDIDIAITAPATDAAREWQGWGTALKPAQEPICLARKPLSEKTVAANVLRWGTGAINVDGCRVGLMTADEVARSGASTGGYSGGLGSVSWKEQNKEPQGRWPANVVTDGSDEVVGMFPETDGVVGALRDPNGSMGYHGGAGGVYREGTKDSGSAARFFYTAKADAHDRIGSKHPTVKPVDLMQWLVRLVTPKGGLVLDPFAGTGTTGEAAFREGFSAVLIEREAEYQDDIRRRVKLMLAGPQERSREIIKQKLKDATPDLGPLFGNAETAAP